MFSLLGVDNQSYSSRESDIKWINKCLTKNGEPNFMTGSPTIYPSNLGSLVEFGTYVSFSMTVGYKVKG